MKSEIDMIDSMIEKHRESVARSDHFRCLLMMAFPIMSESLLKTMYDLRVKDFKLESDFLKAMVTELKRKGVEL